MRSLGLKLSTMGIPSHKYPDHIICAPEQRYDGKRIKTRGKHPQTLCGHREIDEFLNKLFLVNKN